MLILHRHAGESITIGDNIEVMVLGHTEQGGVRLGITAPRDVPVHRREVKDRIQQQETKTADRQSLGSRKPD